MPTAKGTIKPKFGGRFQATFLIDGASKTFTGQFTTFVPGPSPPAVFLQSMAVNYTDVNQLTSSMSFRGTIGRQIIISFDNGSSMNNDAYNYSVDGRGANVIVNGVGEWSDGTDVQLINKPEN